MSLAQILKEKRESRKKELDVAQKLLTKAHTEKRTMTSEETQEWEKRHADGDKMLKEIEMLEKQIEADSHLAATVTDTRSAGREDVTKTNPEQLSKEEREQRSRQEVKLWQRWMADGYGNMSNEERAIATGRMANIRVEDMPPEVRALSASTGSAGAYTIPQSFQYTLDVALKAYGGILENAEYIPTDNGALLPYPSINDTGNSGENLAENTAAVLTQDPTYGVTNLGAYMFDSGIVLVPIQLLQDSAFDIEAYMGEALKTRIGRKLNNACTVGGGSTTATGIVGASTLGVTAASTTAITYFELLDLEHSVDPAYRPKSKYMFNDTTLKTIKKLVDSNNRPLWIAGGVSEGIQGRRPDTINGYGFSINQDMASPASSAKTILFGDLSKYKIRRVRDVTMVRFAERFMDKLQIGLLAFLRADGNLIDAGTHPVKYLVQSAT